MVNMRVLKRRKGKKDYFYLQYSFREGGKVITKEKYLGSEIPKTIEKIKHAIIEEQKLLLFQKLVLDQSISQRIGLPLTNF